MRRRPVSVALLILIASLSAPAWARPEAPPVVGGAAVPFQLTTLDGIAISLEQFRGKALVINFFASWCDPCREEMPLLNELARQADEHGYRVLGVAVEDSRAAVTQFARAAKIAFPIALDTNSRVKRAYRIFGPPATFFVDATGTVRDVVLGPLTAERARRAIQNAGVNTR
jgi:peroxiredoxin